MKKRQFLTAKSISFVLLLAAVCALSTVLLRAQENNEQDTEETQSSRGRWHELRSQRIEGSWDVIVTPAVPPGVPQPPSFHAYGTFARGGAFIGSDRQRPASKQHGVWEYLDGNRYAYTLREDLFDATGNFTGVLAVRVRLTLNGRNEFVGVSNGEQRDANGNLVSNRCATIKGTRIRIEPLADQCQSITPPQ